jgi:uncharacterized membrane protein
VILLPDDAPIEKASTAFFRQEIPVDLALIVMWLAAAIAVIASPFLNQTPLTVVVALPSVLFIPGYCLIAALFPKNDDISLIERIALSFGLSIAVVPLIGLGLNFTPWGIRLGPVLVSLAIFTLVMVLVADYRRARLPPEKRFSVPFSEIAGEIREGFFPAGSSRIDRILSGILIISIIIAIATSLYVIAVPKESEHFTEFYLLGENGRAADYPDQVVTGVSYPMFIGVGNHEYRNMSYTIESWALFTEYDIATNSTGILAMESLGSRSLVLSHNETRVIPWNLSLDTTGYNRVEFLLFNESVPGPGVTGMDRITASYRDLHLWINVSSPESIGA